MSPRDLTPALLGVAAVLSPDILLALGLCFAAGGVRLVARDTSRLWRVALALALLGLGIATWLIATIAGPIPATYSALKDGPLGDPAARMLMLFLAVPATVFLADWRLVPAAIAIVGRIGVEVLPAGVTLWQGVAMPLALVLAIVAVRRRRIDWLSMAVGGYGLWSGTMLGRLGGVVVLGAAMVTGAKGDQGPTGHLSRSLGIIGSVLVVAGSWRVQFVYTVALAGLILWAVLRRRMSGNATP